MTLSARMPDLPAFEVLVAIARGGSIGAAARQVGLTQQAVSARLASMEAQTGVRLAMRSARGSQLTAEGVVVAEWGTKLLDVAERVDAGLSGLRTKRRSRVTVFASLTVAEQLMPCWLVSMRAAAARQGSAAPEVVLTATNSHHAISAVRDGAADVGFIESPVAVKGLRSRVVAHDELILVVPPNHKWARRARPVSAAELGQTPLVSREPGSGTRDSLTAALRRALGDSAPQEPPVLELSSAAAVRGAVVAGAGPAVMSFLAVQDDLTVGRLRAVPVADLDLRRALRAIWAGPRTPPAGGVRDLLAHIATSAVTATTSQAGP